MQFKPYSLNEGLAFFISHWVDQAEDWLLAFLAKKFAAKPFPSTRAQAGTEGHLPL